jgi:hypothetical protein
MKALEMLRIVFSGGGLRSVPTSQTLWQSARDIRISTRFLYIACYFGNGHLGLTWDICG